MNLLQRTIAVLSLLLLCGCPPPAKEGASSGTGDTAQVAQQTPAEPNFRVCLLGTDLGLTDNWQVRQLDALLNNREVDGYIDYQLVGSLPKQIDVGEVAEDVGFPVPDSEIPGSMTEGEAAALLAEVPPCDLLLLASGYIADEAVAAAGQGSLDVGAIIIADEVGSSGLSSSGAIPVYAMRFDICHSAFMAGAAAALSNNISHFMLLGADNDPQVDEYMSAAEAGIKYVSNGAWVVQAVLPVDSRGMVDPEVFRQTHIQLLKDAGPNFNSNHYVLDLTRSNPYILDLIADPLGPLNGYMAGGYSDLRGIAESRVLTCSVKRADIAMDWLLKNCASLAEIGSLAEAGYISFGLAGSRPGLDQSAVGYTSMELYSRFNPDGEDIGPDLEVIWSEIEAGELGLDYCPHTSD